MKLWIPGPTEVRPELLAACATPMIGHRAPEMKALIERIDPPLRHAFGLEPGSPTAVGVHTASATGLMEAALLGCGPRTLHLVWGAFGKRWHKIAGILGKDAVLLEAPMGDAASAERIARALEEEGPFDAVTLTANETSTGVRFPLPQIARILAKHPDTMLFTDLVSYIAGAPVDFDANRLDFAFAGVQKALALPPGVTVIAASERYMEGARARKRPSFYLDPVGILDGHAARKTPSTPCIPLYFALAQQLEDITAGVTLPPGQEGLRGPAAWTARYEKHERMQAQTAAWAARHELEHLPPEPLRSPTVSCLKAGGLDVPAFLEAMKARGHHLSNGYGDLKNQTFRIGHMGDHTEADLAEMLSLADEAIAQLRLRS